jgi:hypothetical protein
LQHLTSASAAKSEASAGDLLHGDARLAAVVAAWPVLTETSRAKLYAVLLDALMQQ